MFLEMQRTNFLGIFSFSMTVVAGILVLPQLRRWLSIVQAAGKGYISNKTAA